MDRPEAVRRLKEHFAIHDDGRPTPYLDEAEQLAYDALERYDLILKKFGSFENVMAAAMIIEETEKQLKETDQMLSSAYELIGKWRE